MKGYSFTELAKLVEAAMPRAGGAFSGNVSAPRFIGPLQGNADTATAAGRADKLSTARNITIGSTTKAFDGTGNLSWSLAEIGAINASATVAAAHKWATPRALQIGNSSKAVDGTANVAWSLAEMGAAAASHTHDYAPNGHGLGTYAGGVSDCNIDFRTKSGFYNASNAANQPNLTGHSWKYYFNVAHSNSAGYNATIAIDFAGAGMAFKAIQGGQDMGWKYVYHTGNKPTAADVGAIAKNTGNVLQNSGFGVGFLSSGVTDAQWIASYFGDNAATGGRVVVGTLATDRVNPYATIGGHNASLTAWAPLAINPGADGTAPVYVGMNPTASSGNGNLFVGNDVESNYMRIRSPIPNDSRYVVNKGYVDGKFAPIAHRENWADKGIHTQTAFGIGWRYYGNGHIICDASSGNIEGISVPKTDAQIAWDNVVGATLVGWNGQSTFGVRVDRARLADAANWSAQSDRATYLNGTVATAGQDITIHGKRAMVGYGSNNQLVINYDSDWGSTLMHGPVALSGDLTVHGGSIFKQATPGTPAIRIDSVDPNSRQSQIWFHQPGVQSGYLTFNHDGWFTFDHNGVAGNASIICHQVKVLNTTPGTDDTLTSRQYVNTHVYSTFDNHENLRFRHERSDLNANDGGQGTYKVVPQTANNPLSAYGHGIKIGSGVYGDGHWTGDIIDFHGNGLHYRSSVNGDFGAWHKFAFQYYPISLAQTGNSLLGHGGSNVLGVHQDGNVTLSAGHNTGTRELYIGYNSPGTGHYCERVVLHRPLVRESDKAAIIGVSGDLYDVGARVYSPNNKPTPDAIGAAAANHSQWRLVAAGDVSVAMANHATGSLRATIDTGINSAHGFVHDAAKYRAVIYTNDINSSNPGACTWGAYGTLRALARWNGPHTIQLDIYSFGSNMNSGTIRRWEVYEVI